MLYCNKCKKEVIVYSISGGAPGADNAIEHMREYAKKEGKMVIFNPSPIQKEFSCPKCASKLLHKK